MNGRYDDIVIVPSYAADSATGPVLTAIHDADFVICEDATIIKDRWHDTPRIDERALRWAYRNGRTVGL